MDWVFVEVGSEQWIICYAIHDDDMCRVDVLDASVVMRCPEAKCVVLAWALQSYRAVTICISSTEQAGFGGREW